jgi:hypothetical protein
VTSLTATRRSPANDAVAIGIVKSDKAAHGTVSKSLMVRPLAPRSAESSLPTAGRANGQVDPEVQPGLGVENSSGRSWSLTGMKSSCRWVTAMLSVLVT